MFDVARWVRYRKRSKSHENDGADLSDIAAVLQHLEAGRLDDADALCRGLLDRTPDDPDTLHVYALVRQRAGDLDNAVDLLSSVRKRQPQNPAVAYNLAVALQEVGRLEDAVRAYRDTLKLTPKDADAHYNLGVAYRALAKPDLAIQSYRKAITAQPKFARAHNNLGNTLRDVGKMPAALESYRAAVACDPTNAEAHVNLAVTAQSLGETSEASLHFNLAADISPRPMAASLVLGRGLIQAGRSREAFDVLAALLSSASAPDNAWQLLGQALETGAAPTPDAATSSLLVRLLDHPTIAPANIASAIIAYLHKDPDISALVAKDMHTLSNARQAVEAAATLSKNALLCRSMSLTPITDQAFERLFCALRRGLLSAVATETAVDDVLNIACALALQAFITEYVFAVTDNELHLVETLTPKSALHVSLIASYIPLRATSWDEDTFAAFDNGPLREVITRQWDEPADERRLADTIETLGESDDATSAAVRAQYEENPYPRWVKPALNRGSGCVVDMLRHDPFAFDVRDTKTDGPEKILIAGCGTGQHAIMTAARFADADVLAVDLSRTSLAYATRQANALGTQNVRFAQADILSLSPDRCTFDIIESVGVLHHMHDPALGWRKLVDCLNPGGLMKLGFYSEIARQDIAHVAERLAREGYRADADGIRRARAFIRSEAENGDAHMRTVSETADFYSASECRDMLFHAREVRLDLLQIKSHIDALKLHFLGFEIRDPAVLRAFKQAYPNPRAIRSLKDWDAFEKTHPAAFREMYQFWCQKKS